MQDFTTGSWTAFSHDAPIVSINVARFDAGKHMALPVVGDAKLALTLLTEALSAYCAPQSWTDFSSAERRAWNAYVDDNVNGVTAGGVNRPISYAQVIGVVNDLCHPRDRIITAAGGLPAEVTANWRTKSPGTVDVEFGFSCMGYEISGGWGARIAQAESEPGARHDRARWRRLLSHAQFRHLFLGADGEEADRDRLRQRRLRRHPQAPGWNRQRPL